MERKAFLNAFNLVSFIGPKKVKSLLEYEPDAERAWNLPSHKLKCIEGWGSLADKFVIERSRIDVKKEWEKILQKDIAVLYCDDSGYPACLREIYLPPTLLYIQGEVRADEKCVAIVGSRKATQYGRDIARRFAADLAATGICVVSGMAMGIDTWAHKGAMESGGRTVAVLGSGVDICYPQSNLQLKKNISCNGAVVSEFPPGTTPIPGNFPRRNRVISGMSVGTIVVEAMERSGALITADFALEQGREVFAVPGSINSPYSRGCNRLIKQGAKLVENLDDVLEELGLILNKNSGKNEIVELQKTEQLSFLSPDEEKVLSTIPYEPVHADELIQKAGINASTVSSTLLNLEINGLIKQMPGKFFVRVK